ncbi:hypothetical protein Hanom_Chr05g00440281 [Helianthus anomalus]
MTILVRMSTHVLNCTRHLMDVLLKPINYTHHLFLILFGKTTRPPHLVHQLLKKNPVVKKI